MKTHILLITSILLGIPSAPTVNAAVKPVEESQSAPLPPIWQNVSPRERLKAVRAAEIDASRLLMENIMSLSLDSSTKVNDLALASDNIRGQISGQLKGVTTTEPPEFLPDGRVQVVRSVKVRQVYEIITRVIQDQKLADGSSVRLKDESSKDFSKRDMVLDVMGNSALPGSDGMKKILAKRAAEMDAYRRLGERMMGVSVSSDSSVRDFAVKSDKVVAALATVLKGAETTGIKYKPDLSCEVTMRIKEADILRTVIRTVNGVQQGAPQDSLDSKVFSETGTGAPPDQANAQTEPVSGDVSQTTEVIEKVLHQEAVSN